MAMLPPIDGALPLLCLHIKAGGSPVSLLNVQALLAVLHRPIAYADGILVLPTSMVLYPVGAQQESLANELPGSKALHVRVAISMMYGLFII